MGLFFIVIFLFLGAWAFYYFSLRQGVRSGELSTVPFTYVDGIPGINQGIDVFVDFTSEKISIDKKHFIPLERIKGLTFHSTKQLTERQKSVIGRAVAGGLILGPVGAILGGISAVGTSKSTETVNLLTIFYVSKDGNEGMALLALHPGYYKKHVEDVVNSINSRLGYIPDKVNEDFEI